MYIIETSQKLNYYILKIGITVLLPVIQERSNNLPSHICEFNPVVVGLNNLEKLSPKQAIYKIIFMMCPIIHIEVTELKQIEILLSLISK